MATAESRDRLGLRGDRLIERAASRGCTVLLGFGAATYLCGSLAWFHSLFDPLPATTAGVIGVALTAAGIGPWLAWRRPLRKLSSRISTERDSHGGSYPIGDHDSAARFAWLTTGGIAVVTGVLTVAVVLMIPLADAVYRWILTGTLWIAGLRGAFEWLLILAGVGAVNAAAGLIAASLSPRFSDAARPAQSRSVALGIVVGAAVGVAVAERGVLSFGSARHVMLVGAGAWFTISIVCLLMVSASGPAPGRPAREVLSPPESIGGLEPVVIAGLLCWGVAIGLSGSVCARVATYETMVGRSSAASLVTVWLLWLCAGEALAGVLKPTRRHSAAGCGFALWLSGVASAGAAGVLATVSPTSSFVLVGTGLELRPAAIAVAMVGLFAGLALPYVKRALLRYGGAHAVTFAEFLSAVLVGAGVGVYAGGAWLIERIGVTTVQCLSGLLCIAVGGVLLLNERSGRSAWRVTRGVAVFGSVVALAALYPRWVQRAVTRPDGLVASMRANAWHFGSSPSDAPPVETYRLASTGEAARSPESSATRDQVSTLLSVLCFANPGQRACIIGADAGPLTSWSGAGFRELDHWPHDRAQVGPADTRRPAASRDRAGLRYVRFDGPAIASWRAWRKSYDLIVLLPLAPGTASNSPIWAAESFAHLQRALAPGGRLVVVLPVFDLDAASLSVVATGLAATTRGDAFWRTWPEGARPEQVWLVACNAPVDREWVPTAVAGGWRRIRELVGAKGPVPIHTFRTPRLDLSRSAGIDRQRRLRSLQALIEPSRRPVR